MAFAGVDEPQVLRPDADRHLARRRALRHIDARFQRKPRLAPRTSISPPALPAISAGEEIHARRADEAGDEQIGGMVVEVERRADLLDHAGAQHHDAVGERHRLDLVVGDEDHGRAEPPVQLLDLHPHLHAQLRVEVGERLVEEEYPRLAHDGAADGDALALAAGKLPGPPVEQLVDLQDLRGLARRAA